VKSTESHIFVAHPIGEDVRRMLHETQEDERKSNAATHPDCQHLLARKSQQHVDESVRDVPTHQVVPLCLWGRSARHRVVLELFVLHDGVIRNRSTTRRSMRSSDATSVAVAASVGESTVTKPLNSQKSTGM